MEFRELEAFVAVAEELHFGRAAERLHISQPALSQQVQRLEADLGAVLLERSSREVRLSPAGAVFLERARALLGDVATAAEAARDVASGVSGRLSIGYVGSTLYGVVPVVTSRLRRLHPRLRLELVERKTAPQLDALRAGTQDVGIVHQPGRHPDGLLLHEVDVEEVLLAVADDHPLAARDVAVPWSALVDLPVVLFPAELEPDTHALLVGAAAAEDVELRVVQEANGLPTILGLIRAGVGVGFVVESVAEAGDRDGISYRRLVGAPRIRTAVAWAADTPNPAVATFLRVLDPRIGRDAPVP